MNRERIAIANCYPPGRMATGWLEGAGQHLAESTRLRQAKLNRQRQALASPAIFIAKCVRAQQSALFRTQRAQKFGTTPPATPTVLTKRARVSRTQTSFFQTIGRSRLRRVLLGKRRGEVGPEPALADGAVQRGQ